MTDGRPFPPTVKPAATHRWGSLLLIVASGLIGVLLVEGFCHLFLPSSGKAQSTYKWMHRVVFFAGPETIFRNQGDIFTYLPRSEIRNLTAFFSDRDFHVEYDYRFSTNNLGLVQDTDVVPERESVLLLGDSFTEGQGAEPWFRLVSPEIDRLGYQAINGGLLGTGFAQWLKLDRYLAANNVRVRKAVVLFISDDYNRAVWNFTPSVLQCLSNLALCRLEESLFYRLPEREKLAFWVDKIRSARAPLMKRLWLGARAEALLPASYHLYRTVKDRLYDPEATTRFNHADQESRAAIGEMIRTYGRGNVVFLHLPRKDEIDGPGPSRLGLQAREAIEEMGGRLFDGFRLCRLTATDYHANDEHPNTSGYAKIADCVKTVLAEITAETR